MSLKLIIYTLGNLLICLAGTMLLPLVVAFYYRATADEIQSDLMAFVISAIITLIVGLILRFSIRARQEELGIREGFAVVALGWVTVALFGTLPYLSADVFHVDGRSLWTEFSFCYFESMAGFSTTGATVLTEIEHLSHAMLFWRSFSHWLGGMGIVVLAVAILPMLGIGGMQLFRAEAPDRKPIASPPASHKRLSYSGAFIYYSLFLKLFYSCWAVCLSSTHSVTPLEQWRPVGSLQKTPASATTIASILTWSSASLCSSPAPISHSTIGHSEATSKVTSKIQNLSSIALLSQ